MGPRRASAVPSAPSWLNALTPGYWYRVSGPTTDAGLSATNVAADLEPGGIHASYLGTKGWASILESWNGAVFVPTLGAHGSVLCWGGGHVDGHLNAVLRWDIETRTWSIYRAAYTTGTFDTGNAYGPYGLFADGSPVPTHTYSQPVYWPPGNRLIIPRTESDDTPVHIQNAVMLPLQSGSSWLRSPINSASHGVSNGYGTYDRNRQCVWWEGGGASVLSKFDPSIDNGDGTFGQFANYKAGILASCVGDYHPIHDKIIALWLTSTQGVYAYDDLDSPHAIGQPGDAARLLTTSNKPTFAADTALRWSQKRQGHLYYSGGENIHLLQFGSASLNDGEWTQITAADNSVVPVSDEGAVCSKFIPVPYGTEEVVFTVDNASSAMYAQRLAA